jgi:hypothetical protein
MNGRAPLWMLDRIRSSRLGRAFLPAAGLVSAGAASAVQETKLYETGPSTISGYVRFVNAASGPVSVTTGGNRALVLDAADGQRIGRFQAVPARQRLAAQVRSGDKTTRVELTVEPDEFVTVAILADASTLPVRDKPQDFNALKADIAFYNADPACTQGVLKAGAKKTVVFSGVAPGGIARRSVNPVMAVLEAACGDAPAGAPVDLGALQAGGRYSVLLIPDGSGGNRLIGAADEKAKY